MTEDNITNTPHPSSCACSRCNAKREAGKLHPPMEAQARNCGLRIADEAIAKAEEDAQCTKDAIN